MADYRLWVHTISPLHIGTGTELRNGFDFITETPNEGEPITLRLNEDRILEQVLEQEYDPKSPNRLPGEMVRGKETNAEYFRYKLFGKPRSPKADSRLLECLKDIEDIPYIPGSTLKGTIRTAVGAHLLKTSSLQQKREIEPYSRNKQRMDNSLEEKLFGKNANADFFRALQVSDALPDPSDRNPTKLMRVYNINAVTRRQTNSSVPIEVEGIQPLSDFFGSLRIDEYVLAEHKRSLVLPERRSLLTKENLIAILREHSEHRLEILQQWYNQVHESDNALKFLDRLIRLQRKLQPNQAFLQTGFGTGWDGMTYSDWLKADDMFFVELHRKLTRKGYRSQAPMPDSAAAFPGSRKVTIQQDKIFQPMGWVLLTLFEKKS